MLYIAGDAYSAPAIWKEDYNAGTQINSQMYYLHRDYLGSILLITDDQGASKEQRHFDAWGNIVKLTDGNGNNLTDFAILDRGYTGHEHLSKVGLIHMNGRLYDPLLHRFLAPDNFVQDPSNTQNYNRYGYVLNNPLSHVDPSGEFIHLIIGAAIGGISNWIANGANFSWKGLVQFGVGAVAGALGAGVGAGISSALSGAAFSAGFLGTTAAGVVGSGFMSGAVVGSAAGFAGGFAGGFGNALLNGSSFGSALGSGLKGGAWGALGGGLIGGTLSGINAMNDGRDFWTGKGMGKAEYFYGDGSGLSGENYNSMDEMRLDYDNNIGSRDGLSLEQIEDKLNTRVTLAIDNIKDGNIMTSDGPAWGETSRYYGGGFANRYNSIVRIAPALKGQSLVFRNLVFKHEFMHSWHINMNFANSGIYSEKATSTFTGVYMKAFGLSIPNNVYRNLGTYPSEFSWRNFYKIIPLWIKP
ncbi:RHS repeat domain-containing protein [Pedobacter alpinus]|uniref:RHS repeat domain-containing protein n=1 Tax=Pedobacter alpinus TaxID=1590643 RepID=A0ABW5TQY2_9SPHI